MHASRTSPAPACADDAGLRLRFLGTFDILRHGSRLEYGRKTPHKPLALLKVLAAEGGRAVDAAGIAGILWPHLEGDAATAAFEVTLHRLRRLLGIDGALRLADRKLSLDPARCDTDIWHFEEVAREICEVRPHVDASADPACGAQVERLLAAYPGHFLAQESHEAWTHACRDRLREKFRRAALQLGVRLERLALWREAASLYTRALELDNVAEPLHRRLMLCCCELGEAAEGMRTYQRCRLLLSTSFGVAPSAETEAIRRRIARATERS